MNFTDYSQSSPFHQNDFETNKFLLSDQIDFPKSVTSSEQFFSAEDLHLSSWNSSGIEKKLITANSWRSPSETLSPTQYITANEEFSSFDLSNKTSTKHSSLSSDSPTLVSNKSNVNNLGSPNSIQNDQSTYDDQNSFRSAQSDHQDFDLVDLRNQIEKPILESPLLMSAYSNYLTIYQPKNLDLPSPFRMIRNSNLNDYFKTKPSHCMCFEKLMQEYRTHWKLKFYLKKEGFSEAKITHKSETNRSDLSNFKPGCVANRMDLSKFNDCGYFKDKNVVFHERKNFIPSITETPARSRAATTIAKDDDKDLKTRLENFPNYFSANFNYENDDEEFTENIFIDIKLQTIQFKMTALTVDNVSLMLSSLQKTLSQLHPMILLDYFGFSTIQSIGEKNFAKRKKDLFMSQSHLKALRLLRHRQNPKYLNRSISFVDRSSKSNYESSLSPLRLLAKDLKIERKMILDLDVGIDRLNISSLQSSVVEEIISFSSLDKVKDLTCILVLNVSLNKLKFNFNLHSREKRNLRIVFDQSSVNNLSFAERALMTRFFTRKQKKAIADVEINAQETIEAFAKETEYGIVMENIQIQLSRLINSSEIVKVATLSVIPCSKTKVDFIYTKSDLLRTKDVEQKDSKNFELFDSVIIFECGFETISMNYTKTNLFNSIIIPLSQESSALFNSNIADSFNLFSSMTPISKSEIKGEIMNIWLIFASSPQRSSFSTKTNFDRYDWHLISSLVPMTIAWISVIDRLFFSVKQFQMHCLKKIRSTMVCLMTNLLYDYLNQKNFHLIEPLKSNSKQMIRIISSLSKTIHDDPSFNLINLIRNYYKNSFKTNTEFDLYFQTIVPDIDELEKILIMLLFHWKDVLPIQISNLNRHVQISLTGANKITATATLASTKNQIFSLFEEKLNSLINNPHHHHHPHQQQRSHDSSKMANLSSTPDLHRFHSRSFGLGSYTENDSIQAHLNDLDSETAKLIDNPDTIPQQSSHLLANRRIDLVPKDEWNLQTEISSNFARSQTYFPEVEFQKLSHTNHLQATKRTNRVHFMNVFSFRLYYERFLSSPIIRNISALCNNGWCGFCTSRKMLFKWRHWKKSSSSLNENNDPQGISDLQSHSIAIPLQAMNSAQQPISNSDLISNEDDDVLDGSNNDSLQSDFVGKKDLYWWMVKQQDFAKHDATTISELKRQSNLKQTESIIDLEEKIDEEQSPLQTDSHVAKEIEMNEEVSEKNPSERHHDWFIGVLEYFDNLSKALRLEPDCYNLKKQIGSDLLINSSINQLRIEVVESEQEIFKNVFDQKAREFFLQSREDRSDQHKFLPNIPTFILDKLSMNSLLLRKNPSEINEMVGNNFKK